MNQICVYWYLCRFIEIKILQPQNYVKAVCQQNNTFYNLLSYKQYGFLSSRFDLDVLTIITYKNRETCDNTRISRATELDIGKVFDNYTISLAKVSLKESPQLSSLSYLVCLWMIFVNGQTSETHGTNAGAYQGSLLVLPSFCFLLTIYLRTSSELW